MTTIPSGVVLASASPARLATLRSAGVEPRVVVSGVDESTISEHNPATLVCRLAELKTRAVVTRLDAERVTGASPRWVIGADSMLALDDEVLGKPVDAADAVRRWRRMRGRTGVLHTGHCLVDLVARREATRPVATRVLFAQVSDAEIDAYVSTGEPLQVAGAFTIDGLGGPFVEGIEGDHHNVVGLSLPALREMVADLGGSWTDLWQ